MAIIHPVYTDADGSCIRRARGTYTCRLGNIQGSYCLVALVCGRFARLVSATRDGVPRRTVLCDRIQHNRVNDLFPSLSTEHVVCMVGLLCASLVVQDASRWASMTCARAIWYDDELEVGAHPGWLYVVLSIVETGFGNRFCQN